MGNKKKRKDRSMLQLSVRFTFFIQSACEGPIEGTEARNNILWSPINKHSLMVNFLSPILKDSTVKLRQWGVKGTNSANFFALWSYCTSLTFLLSTRRKLISNYKMAAKYRDTEAQHQTITTEFAIILVSVNSRCTLHLSFINQYRKMSVFQEVWCNWVNHSYCKGSSFFL